MDLSMKESKDEYDRESNDHDSDHSEEHSDDHSGSQTDRELESEFDEENDKNLNDNWVLWFHNPQDTNWTVDSYKKLKYIRTIKHFWEAYSFLNKFIVENSMLFLMRDGIDPIWEDERNRNGGAWSFKYQKGDLKTTWENFSIYLLAEKLVSVENHDIINGISISPKKNFCIIKIWNSDKNKNDLKLLTKVNDLNYEGGIYKSY